MGCTTSVPMCVSGLIRFLGNMRPTVPRLVKAMGRIVMRCVYFDMMSEFLKANGGVDDKTLCAA